MRRSMSDKISSSRTLTWISSIFKYMSRVSLNKYIPYLCTARYRYPARYRLSRYTCHVISSPSSILCKMACTKKKQLLFKILESEIISVWLNHPRSDVKYRCARQLCEFMAIKHINIKYYVGNTYHSQYFNNTEKRIFF